MDAEPLRSRRIDASGGCLCGAVRYEIDGPLRHVLHCHCENCRRLSGNFVASTGCATTDIEIVDAGGGALRWFDLGYARYGFCGRCGGQLFWQAADDPSRMSVKVGSLDDATGLELVGVWFADDAQPHHTVAADVAHYGANGTSA